MPLSRVFALFALAAACAFEAVPPFCEEGACPQAPENEEQAQLQIKTHRASPAAGQLAVSGGQIEAEAKAPAEAGGGEATEEEEEGDDLISSASDAVVAIFEAGKAGAEGDFDIGSAASLVSGLSPIIGFAVPPLYGIVAAGVMSTAGTVLELFAEEPEKGPSPKAIIKQMSKGFKALDKRLDKVDYKLDSMSGLMNEMNGKLDETYKMLHDFMELRISDMRELHADFIEAWRLYELSLKYPKSKYHTDFKTAVTKGASKWASSARGSMALSSINVAKVFQSKVAGGLCVAGDLYKQVVARRFELYFFMSTKMALAKRGVGAVEELRQLREDLQGYTNVIRAHFGDPEYKEVLRKLEYEGVEACERACAGPRCAIKSQARECSALGGRCSSSTALSPTGSWCLQPGHGNTVFLGACGDGPHMILGPRGLVQAPRRAGAAAEPLCLTAHGSSAEMSPCGSERHQQQWEWNSSSRALKLSGEDRCLRAYWSGATQYRHLQVTIVQAKDVPDADHSIFSNGREPDAYARCKPPQSDDWLSTSHVDNTYSPTWNSAKAWSRYTNEDLLCELYDRDEGLDSDDLLGAGWAHPRLNGQEAEEWIDVGQGASLKVKHQVKYCLTAMLVTGARGQDCLSGLYTAVDLGGVDHAPVYSNGRLYLVYGGGTWEFRSRQGSRSPGDVALTAKQGAREPAGPPLCPNDVQWNEAEISAGMSLEVSACGSDVPVASRWSWEEV